MQEPYPMNDLMIDVRERLVRIETKMDAQAEANAARDEREQALDTRVTSLETDVAAARQSVRTLKYVGGAIATVLTIFGGNFFHFHA